MIAIDDMNRLLGKVSTVNNENKSIADTGATHYMDPNNGEIILFSTCFGLRDFGGLGSRV